MAVPEEAEKVVEIAEGMAPVGGIFHLAMTLTDKMLANQVKPLTQRSSTADAFVTAIHTIYCQLLTCDDFGSMAPSQGLIQFLGLLRLARAGTLAWLQRPSVHTTWTRSRASCTTWSTL